MRRENSELWQENAALRSEMARLARQLRGDVGTEAPPDPTAFADLRSMAVAAAIALRDCRLS